ncbi:MAG: trehalose-phosphatase [Minwuia sp.]|uniref:trehalose-phosphatase n=1 Tax=Minwuia sp. TaxID=2493630 RepID=UPI003A8C29AB
MDRIGLTDAALFLDFDGTLAPLVARPELAAMAAPTRASLNRVAAASGGAVAVISGRPLAQLDALLHPLELPVAGSHGAELRGIDGSIRTLGEAAQAALDEVHAGLGQLAVAENLLIERKHGAVCLHYRGRAELAGRCLDAGRGEVAAHPELRLMEGHMVVEIALRDLDKGTALRAFMSEPPFFGRTPVAAGDDTTDEDAIRAAQALGGIGIRIGDGDSEARIRMAGIDEFLAWLDAVSRDEAMTIGATAP